MTRLVVTFLVLFFVIMVILLFLIIFLSAALLIFSRKDKKGEQKINPLMETEKETS